MPKSKVDQFLDELHRLMAKYSSIPEKEMYETLLSEAEGWEMRLEELKQDEE